MARHCQVVRRGDLPDHADAGLPARSFAGARKSARIKIDGKDYDYPDQLAWPGIATLPGLPRRGSRSPFARGPAGRRADRWPLAGRPHTVRLAELIEREFGGSCRAMFDD